MPVDVHAQPGNLGCTFEQQWKRTCNPSTTIVPELTAVMKIVFNVLPQNHAGDARSKSCLKACMPIFEGPTTKKKIQYTIIYTV